MADPSASQFAKPTPPHCEDCGLSAGIALRKPDAAEVQVKGIAPGGYTWLCGSCAYKRDHPDAADIPPKFRKPRIPQRETLFDAA